jgi:DNA polymerase-3 subunit alpha
MGFLTIEDLKGSVEIICFPEVYRKSISRIKDDRALCIKGTLEHGEEQPKVIASDILTLEEIQLLEAKPIQLILKTEQVKTGDLIRLKEIFHRHPGRRGMRLHLVLEEGQVAVLEPEEKLRVDPSGTFKEDLCRIFGDGADLRGA